MGQPESSPDVDPTSYVADSAILGAPMRPLLSGEPRRGRRPISLGQRCWVGHQCVVGDGTAIGDGTILDNGVIIEGNAEIGAGVLLTNRAYVSGETEIGDECVIGGVIAERTVIGRGCRVFGDLVHGQLNPSLRWDDPGAEEVSPTLEERAFVGWGATIIGPVTIGAGAYVAAGAKVTRSVAPGQIAFGVNRVVRPSAWKGPLKNSPFFRSAT
jgi:acetyltransferase-like isoleucine patch superfamily enzyme